MLRFAHHLHGVRFRAGRVWSRRGRSSGQALLELTLAISFLAYLFAAAIDLGLAYKAYQSLMTATAEAGSYLSVVPLGSCGSVGCNAKEPVDSQARVRFRGEQGFQLKGSGSTIDLNNDGKDDQSNVPAGYSSFDNYMADMVQITEADSSQVTVTNDEFATIGSSYDPTQTDDGCRARQNLSKGTVNGAAINGGAGVGTQCFIVVRARMIYRPFAIAPAMGREMTIRAIAVLPITNGTQQ